jgi:thiol-disulfide isomerase/thioredoxin
MPSFTTNILEYIEPRKIYIWLGFFIVLLIGVAAYAYLVYVPSLPKQIIDGDIANANTRNERAGADIFFFYADWCPHCATAKPLWNNFKENNDGKIVNSRRINCISVDCSDETNLESQRLMTQYEIQGFPTIKMQKGEDVISFDAKITQYSLKEFVNNMV